MSNHSELEQRIARLEAENRELRSLWIENEGDIISQKARLDSFWRLKWWQRIFKKGPKPHHNER